MATDTAIVQRDITPLSLIQDALHKGVAPEVLKELVALQQSMIRFDWEAQERQARIDFDAAKSRCQAKVGLLKPNQGRKSRKSVEANDIFWLDYIGLDAAIRPIYIAEGFAISFSEITDWKEGYVGMTATLSRGGISQQFSKRLTTAPAFDGMPKADAEASAASRVKRYLILQIFNIAVGIDADEKKPYEAAPSLPETTVQEYVDAMNQAPDMSSLRDMFAECWEKAKELKDGPAKKAFQAAYEASKRRLL